MQCSVVLWLLDTSSFFASSLILPPTSFLVPASFLVHSLWTSPVLHLHLHLRLLAPSAVCWTKGAYLLLSAVTMLARSAWLLEPGFCWIFLVGSFFIRCIEEYRMTDFVCGCWIHMASHWPHSIRWWLKCWSGKCESNYISAMKHTRKRPCQIRPVALFPILTSQLP